jgi:hypothetical protein
MMTEGVETMSFSRNCVAGSPERTRRYPARFVTALLIVLASAPMACSSDPEAEAQARALAAIQKLGGTFERDRRADVERVARVDLAGRPVADADLELLEPLTHLNALILRKTSVTDAGMAVLNQTGKLRSLDLDECRVTDAGLEHVGALTSLRGLYLDGTGVTDAGLAHLGSLTKLWGLSLRGTEITDAGLVHLRGLTQLRLLNLEKTRVTEPAIARLRKDLPQARIVWGGEGPTGRRTF